MALHHATSGEVLRLAPIEDPKAHTAALTKTSSFEAIHLVVRAGNTLSAHKVDGSMTLFCIQGHITFEGAHSADMQAGDWIYLEPGAPHSVRAITDSALLLTILFDQANTAPTDG